jgi:hypothetical protein
MPASWPLNVASSFAELGFQTLICPSSPPVSRTEPFSEKCMQVTAASCASQLFATLPVK